MDSLCVIKLITVRLVCVITKITYHFNIGSGVLSLGVPVQFSYCAAAKVTFAALRVLICLFPRYCSSMVVVIIHVSLQVIIRGEGLFTITASIYTGFSYFRYLVLLMYMTGRRR